MEKSNISEIYLFWIFASRFTPTFEPLWKAKLKFTTKTFTINICHEYGLFPHFYATCNTSLHFFNFWWFFYQRSRPSIIPVHLLMKLITWRTSLDFLCILHNFIGYVRHTYIHIYMVIGNLPKLFMFCDPFNAKSIYLNTVCWWSWSHHLKNKDKNSCTVAIFWRGSTKPIS